MYLVGAAVVKQGQVELFQGWGEKRAEQTANLQTLTDVLFANLGMPIIFWSGTGADLPQIRKALRRHDSFSLSHLLSERHLDLYEFARNNLRLPIKYLQLKDVASHFSFIFKSTIPHGMMATSRCLKYRRSRSKQKKIDLKNELMHYHREDLEVLVLVARKLHEI